MILFFCFCLFSLRFFSIIIFDAEFYWIYFWNEITSRVSAAETELIEFELRTFLFTSSTLMLFIRVDIQHRTDRTCAKTCNRRESAAKLIWFLFRLILPILLLLPLLLLLFCASSCPPPKNTFSFYWHKWTEPRLSPENLSARVGAFHSPARSGACVCVCERVIFDN